MSSSFLVFAALFCAANAGVVTWTGIINDEQWSTANNWNPATVPGPTDDVVINSNEGKDATVVLVNKATVKSLTVGATSNHARLRVLSGLEANTVSVDANGVLEINSGNAAVSTSNATVSGEIEFAAGSILGAFQVSGLANFGGQGAKIFDGATVSVSSQQNVLVGGSLQFKGNSTVKAVSAVAASGQNTQFIVMDKSTGNSFVGNGFSWEQ